MKEITDPVHKQVYEWAAWYQFHKDTPMDVIQRVKFLERCIDGFMTSVLMLNQERLIDKKMVKKDDPIYYSLIKPTGGKFRVEDETIQ